MVHSPLGTGGSAQSTVKRRNGHNSTECRCTVGWQWPEQHTIYACNTGFTSRAHTNVMLFLHGSMLHCFLHFDVICNCLETRVNSGA
jgi:hypothetical protein